MSDRMLVTGAHERTARIRTRMHRIQMVIELLAEMIRDETASAPDEETRFVLQDLILRAVGLELGFALPAIVAPPAPPSPMDDSAFSQAPLF